MRTMGTIGVGLVIAMTASATAHAGVLEHQTLKGKAAVVEFLTSTPETCADGSAGSSDLFVSANGEESFLTSRAAGKTLINALSVIVVVSDSCTGATSLATGQVSGGFNGITPRRATLNATVPLTDVSTGAPAGTLSAALTLQGGSIVAFTNEHDKTVFPDNSFRTDQVKSTTRPATVTGSLTVNGVQLIGHVTLSLLFDNRDSVTDIAR
jgi:hypothetical protein